MSTESFVHQKKVRAMGTTLIIVSCLALLTWVIAAVSQLIDTSEPLDQGEIAQVDQEIADQALNAELQVLTHDLTAETTVRELIAKDEAFYEEHKGLYNALVIVIAVFFAILATVILRMAMTWRRGDPFGRGTILGLRWLGILLLAQFFTSIVVTIFLPDPGYTHVVFNSAMFDDLPALFNSGANLSCGIVFLTLSWVLEHGQKMKQEQALTI